MKLYIFSVFTLLSFTAPAQAAGNAVSISAVGDIMMGTDYPSNMLPADDGRSLFKYSKERLSQADIRFGNFEDTFFDGDKSAGGKSAGPNRYIFRTPTRYGQWLADAGFNVVSLANNHAMDFGSAGILSTKQTLRKNNIQYSSKAGGEVAQFNVRGLRVALIATDFYTGERSITTPSSTYQEIRTLKKQFDLVIVSAHAGREGAGAERTLNLSENFLGENRGNSVAFAHQAIDAGAAMIIMHGPHVPRGLEIYMGHLIAYSLGNFLTGPGISVQGIAGLAPFLYADLDQDGKLIRGYLTSFRQIRGSGTVYDSENAALRFIKNQSDRDFPTTSPLFNPDGTFLPKQ